MTGNAGDWSVVGLIPARAGSKRISSKNVRHLAGHPLLAYSIASALESDVFAKVLVSTDSAEIADIARHYGADVPHLRPASMAGDMSPDIAWVQHAVANMRASGLSPDAISILRPTSPLRSAGTIRRAVAELAADPEADSLRAVERCTQHPGKMWVVEGDRMRPLLDDGGSDPPWHSRPYQALPLVHVQNASLEVARTRALDEHGSIAGAVIRPFHAPDHEGFDLNQEADWIVLEALIRSGRATLPAVCVSPYDAAVSASSG